MRGEKMQLQNYLWEDQMQLTSSVYRQETDYFLTNPDKNLTTFGQTSDKGLTTNGQTSLTTFQQETDYFLTNLQQENDYFQTNF